MYSPNLNPPQADGVPVLTVTCPQSAVGGWVTRWNSKRTPRGAPPALLSYKTQARTIPQQSCGLPDSRMRESGRIRRHLIYQMLAKGHDKSCPYNTGYWVS